MIADLQGVYTTTERERVNFFDRLLEMTIKAGIHYTKVNWLKVPADSLVQSGGRDTSWNIDTLGDFLNSLR